MSSDEHSLYPAGRPPAGPPITDDLLDRYAGGECTPAEAEAVARWIEADPAAPARQELIERLRAVWEASRRPGAGAPEPEAWDVDAAWRRAAGRMRRPKVFSLHTGRAERPRWAAWIPAPALRAASILFVAGSAAFLGYLIANGQFLRTGAPPGAMPVPAREYVTARGQRASMTLVDGTRVMLGAASKLIVPADYGRAPGDTAPFTARSSAGPRVVTLEGEGYFEVTHDAARPFAVRAGRGLVRDIGTKFVVRAYEPGRPVEVAVTEGEVLLQDASLRQGDLGRLDTTGAVRVRRSVDLRPYTGWTEGRLVFDETPLREAIPVLERWYDLEITVADSALYDRRLFATLADEPAFKVLDLIALSLDLAVERRGQAVTFRKKSP